MSKREVRCLAKHTTYDPSDDEWMCPKCGADYTAFYIVDSDPDADPECSKLHNDDYVECEHCGYEGSGRSVARRLLKKKNMVRCPCCKGKGYVDRKIGENLKIGKTLSEVLK